MVEQVFRAIVAGKLSLLKIIRSKNNLCLSSINPELFSEAVIRLEVFDGENIHLSTDHYRAILDKIIETEDLKLKRYDIARQSYLSGIPADTVMKAAVKLEETNIYKDTLIDYDLFIVKCFAESPIMNLKRLVVEWRWMTDVPPDVLAADMVRFEEVNMKGGLVTSDLSDDHFFALFNKIANSKDIKLRKLETFDDLSHISPDILAEAVITYIKRQRQKKIL